MMQRIERRDKAYTYRVWTAAAAFIALFRIDGAYSESRL